MKKLVSLLLCACLLIAIFPSAPAEAAGVSSSFLSNCSTSYKSGKYYSNLAGVTLSGNPANDLITVASSQVGYHEGNSWDDISGSSTGSGDYTEYNKWYPVGAQAWCNLFVSWCFAAAGISTSIAPKNPFYLSQWRNCGAKVYSWKDYKEGLFTPTTGDIIIYGNSSTNNISGSSLSDSYQHISILKKYSGGTIYSIDGNYSDKVTDHSFSPNSSTGYVSGSGYIHAIIQPSYNCVHSYLDKCTVYPTNLTVKTTSATNLKSLPCSWNTDQNSATLEEIPIGSSFTVKKLYRNEVDNWDSCWYQVTYNGKEGYVFSGNTSVTNYGGNTVSYSGGNPIPTTIEYGHGYYAAWLISSNNLQIDTIQGFIYDNEGNALSDYSGKSKKEGINAMQYQMGSEHGYEAVDSNLLFGDLPAGNYSCEIKVKCKYYYGDSNGNLQTKLTGWGTPISFSFTKQGDTSSYLDKCRVYPTNLTVKTTSATNLKSLPCSWNTDQNSATLEEIPVGSSFTVKELYRNEVDNWDSCWYQVTYNGKEGYIFSGNTSVESYRENTVTASGGTTPPSTIPGESGYYATWLLSSDYLNIDAVFGFIYDELGNTLSGYPSQKTDIFAKTYQLGSENSVEPVDAGLHFSTLDPGNYSCKISVRTLYYYGSSDGSLQTKQRWYDPISWNFTKGSHSHDKGAFKYYSPAHPHYNCYECSVCGKVWEDREETNYLTTCDNCRPGKPAFINMKETYDVGTPVTFAWNPTEHTTHYNFYLYKENAAGEYIVIERIMGNDETLENPTTRMFEVGKYRALLQAYDNQHWLSDHSDWAYTESDFVYFEVGAPINYTITYDANGGTGAPEDQIKTHGEALTLSDVVPVREGYAFLGWASSQTATAAEYQPGDSFTTDADTVLYAVWEYDVVASGVWGDLDWVIDSGGTLTISGSGPMNDNAYFGSDNWTSYKNLFSKVVIEEGVTSVGSMAFMMGRNITQVSLPHSITSIGSAAFWLCTNLSEIAIPGQVTSINSSAFGGCSSLVGINVAVDNQCFSSIDGILYDKAATSLLCCPGGKTGVCQVPNTVTIIGYDAFNNCKGLTDIILPEGVINIGDSAFCGCSGLSGITLPANLTSIGDSVFCDCSSLSSIMLPASITSIGSQAFSGCDHLTAISLTANVTSIDDGAFEYCNSLNDVYFDGSEVQRSEREGAGWSTEDNEALFNAQWHYAIELYTVSYNANGGTGAPANQTKTKDVALTLSSTKPTRSNASAGSYTVTLNANGGSVSQSSLSAARTTKYTFKNWNTAQNGSGTSYNPGASYTANADVTFYAQWNSSTTTALVTLPTPTREGYEFKGWATSSTASSGVTGSYTPSGNVTLYAIWKVNTYTVSYDANGGTGAPASQTKTKDAALTLSSTKPTRSNASAGSYTVTLNANGGSVSPTSLSAARTTKYTFKNWNTEQNGSGASYNSGASYTANADVTLYAQWNSSTSTAKVTLPTATRNGCILLGWAKSKTAQDALYQPGDTMTPTGSLTLYAVWLDLSAPDGLLPASLKQLEDEALAGCGFLYVKLPEGASAIGSRVFDGSVRLRAVYIPANVTNIATDAFDGAPEGLTIVGKDGSYAEFFAGKHGFNFVEG